MQILLFILYALLYIFLFFICVTVLLLLIRFFLRFTYKNEQVEVHVGALGFEFRVYPPKKRKAKAQSAEDDKEEKAEKPAADEPSESEQKPKRKVALKKPDIDFIIAALQGAKGIAKAAIKALKIRDVNVYWPIKGEDAADTAISYGRANAAAAAALSSLANIVDIKVDSIEFAADFSGKLSGEQFVEFKVGERFLPVVLATVPVLIKLLIKYKKLGGNNNG